MLKLMCEVKWEGQRREELDIEQTENYHNLVLKIILEHN